MSYGAVGGGMGHAKPTFGACNIEYFAEVVWPLQGIVEIIGTPNGNEAPQQQLQVSAPRYKSLSFFWLGHSLTSIVPGFSGS